MTVMDANRVRGLLRDVRFPDAERSVVEEGLIGRIVATWPRVEIELLLGGRQRRGLENVATRIRGVLAEAGFADIRLNGIGADTDHGHVHGSAGCGDAANRLMTPLQAEFLEDGELPEDDLLAVMLGRYDVANEAGYRPGGPEPLAGPRESFDYTCDVAVLQWDIDPHNSTRTTRQHEIKVGEWDYRIWWQVHPSGDLLYVSMQAMREDWVVHEGASPHPVGRSEAVNLVFDQTRDAVVAVYGTVRDFRPFVKAFSIALEIESGAQSNSEESSS